MSTISIHAPHTGSDADILDNPLFKHIFQSTPPTRGATKPAESLLECPQFQSTPHTRGATQIYWTILFLNIYFNPRPPHGERLWYFFLFLRLSRFQSTPPTRGATLLRAGNVAIPVYFNPRPPHGERQQKTHIYREIWINTCAISPKSQVVLSLFWHMHLILTQFHGANLLGISCPL